MFLVGALTFRRLALSEQLIIFTSSYGDHIVLGPSSLRLKWRLHFQFDLIRQLDFCVFVFQIFS